MSTLEDNLDTIEALRAALAAWTEPGDYPALHANAQQRLRITWPGLAAALDRAAGLDAPALHADAMRAAAGQVPAPARRRPWDAPPSANRTPDS